MTYTAALAALLRTVFGDQKRAEHIQSGVVFSTVDGTFDWNAVGAEFLVDDDEGNRYRVLIEARGKGAKRSVPTGLKPDVENDNYFEWVDERGEEHRAERDSNKEHNYYR